MNSNQNPTTDHLLNALRAVHGDDFAKKFEGYRHTITGYGADVEEPTFRVDTDSESGRS